MPKRTKSKDPRLLRRKFRRAARKSGLPSIRRTIDRTYAQTVMKGVKTLPKSISQPAPTTHKPVTIQSIQTIVQKGGANAKLPPMPLISSLSTSTKQFPAGKLGFPTLEKDLTFVYEFRGQHYTTADIATMALTPSLEYIENEKAVLAMMDAVYESPEFIKWGESGRASLALFDEIHADVRHKWTIRAPQFVGSKRLPDKPIAGTRPMRETHIDEPWMPNETHSVIGNLCFVFICRLSGRLYAGGRVWFWCRGCENA